MTPAQIASIIGLAVQATVYGIYLATLYHALRFHIFGKDGGKKFYKIKWTMTIVIIVIFMLSTIDMAIMVPMVAGRGPPALAPIAAAIECLTIQIVDMVLIYRCWVVYGHSWRIICIPFGSWVSCLVCLCFDIYYQFLALGMPYTILQQGKQFRFAFFACHIATNVFATSASCYRILTTAKEVQKSTGNSRLSRLGRMLLYSGALFMLTSILNLIFGWIGFTPDLMVYQVTSDALNFSMAGMTFNFIVIYVGQERAKEDDGPSHPTRSGTKSKKTLSTLQFQPHTSATVSFGPSCGSSDCTESP